MRQSLGKEWGAQRGSLETEGCGSLILALEESRLPQTDGAQGCRESSSAVTCTSQEVYVDMEEQESLKGTMLERRHLELTLCQFVPGTFISLLMISLHSAAHSLLRRKLQLRMVKRSAQGHTVAE